MSTPAEAASGPAPLVVIILAAGEGKRMRSSLPKVLHPLAGRPLLAHVVATARALDPAAILVVHGHGGEQVSERLGELDVEWVLQAEQLGTGHAVAQALPHVPGRAPARASGEAPDRAPDPASDQAPGQAVLLVLYGDVPLVGVHTLGEVVEHARGGALALVTVDLEDPAGYGRIVRDGSGRVSAIVEERDASESERAIREVNTGILAAPAAHLGRWLARLDNDNAQGEYYLTDTVAAAVADGVAVQTALAESVEEVLGVNDRAQLARLERVVQAREAARLMREGVTLLDPARVDLRGEVRAGEDVTIDVNVVLEGRVVLGDGVRIGPGSVVRDAEIGARTRILEHCVVEGARIGPECRIGPFARIRPQTRLGRGVHVGNYVEVKKSDIGEGSKVNHLSYVGDAEIGRRVNVGAGTITCNYDGANKHRTVIGDDAFIGSGTELVAPVTVGAGATVGAGSTISKDVPPGTLAVARSRQQVKEGWKRPTKKRG